jgi:hypothetical protein
MKGDTAARWTLIFRRIQLACRDDKEIWDLIIAWSRYVRIVDVQGLTRGVKAFFEYIHALI